MNISIDKNDYKDLESSKIISKIIYFIFTLNFMKKKYE